MKYDLKESLSGLKVTRLQSTQTGGQGSRTIRGMDKTVFKNL